MAGVIKARKSAQMIIEHEPQMMSKAAITSMLPPLLIGRRRADPQGIASRMAGRADKKRPPT